MSMDMFKKTEGLMKDDFGKGKFKISLRMSIDTGNLPYSVTLYVIYLPEFCMEIYDCAGIKGILTKETPTPIGVYEKALMEALLHICDNPEIYVENAFLATVADYHTAIHMLADIITHVKWYPNAEIRCQEV